MLFYLIFGISLLYSIWAVNIGWQEPISDQHEFRQTQTAITAYYLVRGGSWLSYETPVFGPPWTVPFEFPLFQLIVAGVVTLLNLPLNQAGRLVSVFFFYMTLIPSYILLAQLGVGREYRFMFLSLLLVSPLYLFWSRTFMIESTALFFGLAYLACVVSSLNDASVRIKMMGCVVGTVGALTKATTFIPMALIALIIFLFVYRKRCTSPRDIVLSILMFLLIPAAISATWTFYTDYLKTLSPLTLSLTSHALLGWNFGSPGQRIELFVGGQLFRMVRDILGGWITLLFVLAIGLFYKRKTVPQGKYILICLCSFFLGLLIFTNLHLVHQYYQYANGIFLIGAIGFFLHGQFETGRNAIGWVLFSAVIISCLIGYKTGYLKYQLLHAHPASLATSEIVQRFTDEDSVLWIYGSGFNSAIPYYSKRKAVMSMSEPRLDDPITQLMFKDLDKYKLGGIVVCGDQRLKKNGINSIAERVGFGMPSVYKSSSCDLYVKDKDGAALQKT